MSNWVNKNNLMTKIFNMFKNIKNLILCSKCLKFWCRFYSNTINSAFSATCNAQNTINLAFTILWYFQILFTSDEHVYQKVGRTCVTKMIQRPTFTILWNFHILLIRILRVARSELLFVGVFKFNDFARSAFCIAQSGMGCFLNT